MENCKAIVSKAGIVPRLQLVRKEGDVAVPTGQHKVKLISDKLVKGADYQSGVERPEVQFLLEEGGVKKTYNVPVKDKNGDVHYLVQRFAEIEAGEEIILEAKKKGVKTYIDLQRTNNTGDPVIDEGQPFEMPETDDIPVVEDENMPPDTA